MSATKIMTLAAAAVLGLAACGGGPGPEDTVKEFTQAAHDEDYERYCDLLAPDLVKTFESAAGGRTCTELMEEEGEKDDSPVSDIDPDKLKITGSTESDDGTSATVSTEYEGQRSDVKLVKVDDEWKIGGL